MEQCVLSVLNIRNEHLEVQIHIVDDASSDESYLIALKIAEKYTGITVHRHQTNLGKGAALRTGFKYAQGDFIAIQDADLEYDPNDLKRLVRPLIENKADVVFGSRFLSSETHRVLYFWHSVGNSFLTFFSNMMTDLNLTDMESCYKIFRKEIIQKINIEENRFGFEPEIVAKVAHMRVRIYEMGISYFGRTYEEGKKIGWKDGIRALYCILRYNLFFAPAPVQLLIYLLTGGIAAFFNLLMFLGLRAFTAPVHFSAPLAFIFSSLLNYLFCYWILFRYKSNWNALLKIVIFIGTITGMGYADLWLTETLIKNQFQEAYAKITATVICIVLNFISRRLFISQSNRTNMWKPQIITENTSVAD